MFMRMKQPSSRGVPSAMAFSMLNSSENCSKLKVVDPIASAPTS